MGVKTIYGCKCKSKFKIPGKYGGTFKQCVYGEAREECPVVKTKKELKKACQNTTPWCNVEGACGIHTPRVKGHWDYCDWPKPRLRAPPIINDPLYYISGLVIYLIIFGLVIPLIFYKLKWFDLLEVWVPNLDLLATALQFRFGPFNTGIFSFIYSIGGETSLEKWSQMTLNYIALLGLTFVVARRTYKSKSIAHGWSVAFIMILLTYLIPNDYIDKAMEWCYSIFLKKHTEFSSSTREKLAVFIGLLVALSFIQAEKMLIKTQASSIEKYIKKVFIYFKIPHKI